TDSVIAELALDRVRLHGPEGAQPETRYYEIEIESRQGDRRDITALSRQLQRDFNLVPSGDSKFARGLTLLYGGNLAAAQELPVLLHEPIEEATRHIVGRHLRRLRLHDPGTRIGRDPEALHDMRVATRRLRAAVRLFAAGIPKPLQRALDEELHWLGR